MDEFQNAPEILSYLQEVIDTKEDKRKFVLTGSNSLLLNEKISQSLAGRVRVLKILPLLRTELPETERPSLVNEALFKGGYPRIYDEDLEATNWLADYYNTYVQKDVRTLLEVSNLPLFDKFVRICAGQLINFSSIGTEVGVKHPTVSSWLSALEASFLIFILQPHFKNFNKRIIKSPKLYFYDTGLLCYLLRIKTAEQLESHPLRGAIFENWVISEKLKHDFSKAKEPAFYFWRDQHGHEVDLVSDESTYLLPTEIKSGATFGEHWLSDLTWFNNLQDYNKGQLVYGGEKSFTYKNVDVVSWVDLSNESIVR